MTQFMEMFGFLLSVIFLVSSLLHAIIDEYEKATFWMVYALVMSHAV